MFGLTAFRRNDLMNGNNLWDMDKFFDSFFDEPLLPSMGTMQVDIKEDENSYSVLAEMPGVKKEEIKVNVEDNVLTIAVERNEEVNEEKNNYIRKERKAFNAGRSFKLKDIKVDEISAKLEDGILTLNLPKVEVQKPEAKQIDIQ